MMSASGKLSAAQHALARGGARRGLLALFGAAAMCAMGAQAHAETLAEAIALAYQNNPSLRVQREQLKALDEQFVQASQSLRPQLTFDAVTRNTEVQLPAGGDTNVTSATAGLSATQVLSTFGRTTAQISVAEANILAARENLRQGEAQIILQVIQAYAAVRRDEANVSFSSQAVAAFQGQVDQAQARLRGGDGTLTDTGQAEAQLASTQASLAQSQSILQQSRATYARLVGQNPGTLEPIGTLPNMPAAVQAAYEAAEQNSPAILEARLNERAGRSAVRAAKSEFRPTLSLTGQFAYTGVNPWERLNDDYHQEAVIGLSLSAPILTGGVVRSRVREAEANNRALVASVEVARRQVVESVSSGWNQIVTSERQFVLGNEAVRAARQSNQGARLEFDEGFRSFFEVLNEQQRLLEAQRLVTAAEYNRVVGQAEVLSAIGELDADRIVAGLEQYDPAKNFDDVKRKGWTPLDPVISAVDRFTGPALPPPPKLITLPAPTGVSLPAATNTSFGAAGLSTAVPTAPQGDLLGDLIKKSDSGK